MPQGKGSKFEREICKDLSRWWSEGTRDDIFWRSAISGGRATLRSKQGKKTFGSYGDIAAVDPIGAPLLALFTIELKCGRSHGHPSELWEPVRNGTKHKFAQTLFQAIEAHHQAGSITWMLICRQDFRRPIVYLGRIVGQSLGGKLFAGPPSVRYDLMMSLGKSRKRIQFLALPLEDFFRRITPKDVLQMVGAKLIP